MTMIEKTRRIWIFDLDDTLYNTRNYANIIRDNKLIELISDLDGERIIMTNAHHFHCFDMLDRIGINHLFDYIFDRNNMQGLKPSIKTFITVIKNSRINKTDHCVFFEDNIINLITAKIHFGWTTVLITSTGQPSISRKDKTHIDYIFPSIHCAIEYFTSLN